MKNECLAFPYEFKYSDGTAERSEGMTLRDYFAAKAMQAIIAKSPFLDNPQTFEVYQKTAIGAYDYADAMLAHRSK